MAQERDILDQIPLEKIGGQRPACIVIPTTDGLVWLCGLKERSATLNSHMTLAGDFRQLTVSKEYHQFVSMPLKQIRDKEASVHIELSEPIDSGRSWEFPVLLAHILHQHNLLAFPDLKALEAGNDPGCDLIWSTGKLDADLVPVVGDYRLSQKFCLSEDTFETFRHHNRSVDVILGGPLSEDIRRKTKALASRHGLKFQEVSHFEEIDFLNQETAAKKVGYGKPYHALKKVISKSGAFAIASFLSIIGMSLAVSSMMSEDTPPKTIQAEISQPKPLAKQANKEKVKASTPKTSDDPKLKAEGKHVQTDHKLPEDQKERSGAQEKIKTVTPKISTQKDVPEKNISQNGKKKDKDAPVQAVVKPAKDKALAVDHFVIEALATADRSPCRSAVASKRYCTDNLQACQSLGKTTFFRATALKADKGQAYLVHQKGQGLCGLRFRNIGQKSLTMRLNQRIAPFAFHGSDPLFRPITLKAGQSTELYLQQLPRRLKSVVEINETGATPISLTLQF